MVEKYKFLGLQIDYTGSLQVEVSRKKQMEQTSRQVLRRLATRNLYPLTRFITWQTMIASKVMYQVVETAGYSKAMRSWLEGYYYRAAKCLLRI